MSGYYLSGLDLTGRRVVVVGGGTVAQRRLPSLMAAGATVELIAPALTPTLQGLAGDAVITWQSRGYRPGDLDGAWYVLALTDDPEVNAAVAADAHTARIFCVRGDAAGGGTAVTPATAEVPAAAPTAGAVGPVQLAVLGGGDPRRAVALRDSLAEALRQNRFDLTPQRRAGTGTAASGRLAGVAIVGGGPGDPELITVRGQRLVAAADVVIADRLAPQQLLADLGPHVEVIDAAKLPRGRAMAQERINQIMVERAAAGAFVVRLKGGDPFVFGRGSEEVDACVQAGVPVTVVPGVTSALSVPALAGIPLTHRGLAHEAVIVSGHLAPGAAGSKVDWAVLAQLRGTLLVLMGVEHLAEIVAALLTHGRDAATPVAIVQDGSLPGQRAIRATLDRIVAVAEAEGVRAPAVIVVGAVAALGAPSRTDQSPASHTAASPGS
ncbi:MAG: uroporphyrinogen-III C-methyltransferase [Kineosporiaceae bacterium]|nr:uroporphyrinogen-III C-methyltransferase [Kineosporiaceae bacterium]MBK7621581.1 uroporphyrinogen-III C-methyltransferase [Kineosporiaceae bacterium]MBK8077256.1 uroporphyrinogen-III C-methyltransferase [Kineosporiaceae bacterium]